MEQQTIHPDALQVSEKGDLAPFYAVFYHFVIFYSISFHFMAFRGVFGQLADVSRLAWHLPVYRKLRCLGRGAFGKAYLVEVVRGRKEVQQRVLKKLPLAEVTEQQREAAFREAQLMRKTCRNCPSPERIPFNLFNICLYK